MEALLRDGLSQLGLPLDAIPGFLKYGGLLLETNRVLNLTAIIDPGEVARLHFLDCAALLTLERFQGKSVVDVGTGAGFPGLPLKIVEPSISLTLLDAQQKRVRFLESVCGALELSDVKCFHGRAEELARREDLREQFDFAVSRAVADLRMLCELCLPFVKTGGLFLAMKSVSCQQELLDARSAVRQLGGVVEDSRDYQIPGTDIVHRVLFIRKIAPVPDAFPRPFARIKKKPL